MAAGPPEPLEPILRGKDFEIARMWKKASRVNERERKRPFLESIEKLETERTVEQQEKLLGDLQKALDDLNKHIESHKQLYNAYSNSPWPWKPNAKDVEKQKRIIGNMKNVKAYLTYQRDKRAANLAKRNANLAEIAERNIQTNYTIARKSRRGRRRSSRRQARKTRRN